MVAVVLGAHLKVQVRAGGETGDAHFAKQIPGLYDLPVDHVDFIHVRIDGVEALALVAKFMADGYRQPVGVVGAVVAQKQTPACPDDLAGAGCQHGGAFGGRNVHAGVDDVGAVEHAAVTIVGQGPVDFVGGDGAGEEEVVVGGEAPGHFIQRRAPQGDGGGAGGGQVEAQRFFFTDWGGCFLGLLGLLEGRDHGADGRGGGLGRAEGAVAAAPGDDNNHQADPTKTSQACPVSHTHQLTPAGVSVGRGVMEGVGVGGRVGVTQTRVGGRVSVGVRVWVGTEVGVASASAG